MLVELLQDPRAAVRADALGGFGAAASQARDVLKRLAGDQYLTVQLAAEDALTAIDAGTSSALAK